MAKASYQLKRVWILFALLVLSVSGWVAWCYLSLPQVKKLDDCMTSSMHNVRLCPSSQNYIPLSEIPAVVVDSVLVSEDASFFRHSGFNWHEVFNSIKKNIKVGRYERGASTITQQLAKNVFLSGNKTLTRKLKEAFLTIQIENRFSKKTILERYLNVVEFAPQVYGLKKAANHYFNKSPKELHVLEAAYLAFVLPNPDSYHHYFEEKELSGYARQRILDICSRLYRYDRIPEPAYQAAKTYLDAFPWKWVTRQDFRKNTAFTPTGSPSNSISPRREQ